MGWALRGIPQTLGFFLGGRKAFHSGVPLGKGATGAKTEANLCFVHFFLFFSFCFFRTMVEVLEPWARGFTDLMTFFLVQPSHTSGQPGERRTGDLNTLYYALLLLASVVLPATRQRRVHSEEVKTKYQEHLEFKSLDQSAHPAISRCQTSRTVHSGGRARPPPRFETKD
jgi:hypothetical protein